MGRRLLSLFFIALATFTATATHLAHAAIQGEGKHLWVTMHTASIDNYCTPCMVSERLLKESNVEFTKILEPMGPWPWFQLTDSRGNQRRLNGALTQQDVDAIKRGEFPDRD